MPLTPEMRRSIDQIRDYLYGGGYPDPVSNAEQLSFLFFFYLIEGIDAENAARAKVLEADRTTSIFAGEWTLQNPLNAPAPRASTTIPRERFRWSVWAQAACPASRWCASCATRCSRSSPRWRRTAARQLHERRAARRSTSRPC